MAESILLPRPNDRKSNRLLVNHRSGGRKVERRKRILFLLRSTAAVLYATVLAGTGQIKYSEDFPRRMCTRADRSRSVAVAVAQRHFNNIPSTAPLISTLIEYLIVRVSAAIRSADTGQFQEEDKHMRSSLIWT